MRYQVQQSANVLRIDFKPRLTWMAWVLYGGILLILGVASACYLPESRPPLYLVFLGLAFLTPFVFYVTYRESIVGTTDTLRVEHRTIGAIRWHQEYSVEDVRWFRAVEEEWSQDESWMISMAGRAVGGAIALTDGREYRRFLGCGRNEIAFNVGTLTHWAGPGLRDEEAASVAALMRDWIHSHQRTVDTAYT